MVRWTPVTASIDLPSGSTIAETEGLLSNPDERSSGETELMATRLRTTTRCGVAALFSIITFLLFYLFGSDIVVFVLTALLTNGVT